jgi:hypothetical protein
MSEIISLRESSRRLFKYLWTNPWLTATGWKDGEIVVYCRWQPQETMPLEFNGYPVRFVVSEYLNPLLPK